MEMDDAHTNNNACSFSSVVNGGGGGSSGSSRRSKKTSSSSKVDFGMLKKRGEQEESLQLQGGQYQEGEAEEEDEEEGAYGVGGRNEETHHGRGVVAGGGLAGWQNSSSRIIRVSRATGGKDRHSKVLTSRGLRDRRIRLSVTTAIQFYDLQDRLGYDQPSKAVDWLINAAADPIAELPSLNNCFSTLTQQQLMTRSHNHSSSSRNKRRQSGGQLFDSIDDVGFDPLPLSKSACSSTSETSRGSGLSLARTDVAVARVSRVVKSRERATGESPPISQRAASFSELLAAAGDPAAASSAAVSANDQQSRMWPATAMDYFNTSTTFSGQTHHGNILQQSAAATFNVIGIGGGGGCNNNQRQHQHAGLQQLSLVQDHIIPGSVSSSSSSQPAGSHDYNLNFTISSAAGVPAAFNRGTLQSNLPSSMWPHVQRFAPADGSINNLPIFIGTATPVDNNHHHHHHPFPSAFDSRLQLCYGDGNSRHSDQKAKGEH